MKLIVAVLTCCLNKAVVVSRGRPALEDGLGGTAGLRGEQQGFWGGGRRGLNVKIVCDSAATVLARRLLVVRGTAEEMLVFVLGSATLQPKHHGLGGLLGEGGDVVLLLLHDEECTRHG